MSRHILLVACWLVVGASPVRAADDPAPPLPPGATPATPPPPGAAAPRAAEDAPGGDVAESRRKRQELDQRKAELKDEALPALRILEEFRAADVRLWAGARRRVVLLGPSSVPALRIMLEETDWEVRAISAACLGDLRDAGSLDALVAALGRETFTEARRRMVVALNALGRPEAVSALRGALKDPDLGIVLAALRGLGALGLADLVPTLTEFATHTDLDVRYEALGSLAALGAAPALERLERAAQALVSTRDLQRIDSVEVFDHHDRYEQYLLGLALARVREKRVLDLLGDVLAAKKPWEHKSFLRLGAAEGLGRRAAGGEEPHPMLVQGLAHDDAPVRVACSYGLGFARTHALVRPLSRALGDSQLDVRLNVVRALGAVATPEAAKVLARTAARDRTADVRVATVRALVDVDGDEAAEALLDLLKDEKYVVRVLAARALGRRTADPGVLQALGKATDDPDFGVRAQAVASLSQARTQPEAAAPILVAALRDRDVGVQANACYALAALLDRAQAAAALDAPTLTRVLGMALETQEERVRLAAVELLDGARPPQAVLPLIAALAADRAEMRQRAHALLQRMAERLIEFAPEGSVAEREAGIRRWREWWDGRTGLPERVRVVGAAVTGSLADQARDIKWRGLDIALLLDSTGSMAGLLRAAKQAIDDILFEIESPLPSLRVSLYTYRDMGDNYVFYGTPLTWDVDRLPGFLQSFVHGQGGDIPEAVRSTVAGAMKHLAWRPEAQKVIIFAGDAPHHPEEDGAFRNEIREWATAKNRAVLHALFTDTNRRSLDIARRRQREDPEAFEHPYFEIYRRVAELGRGRGVLLSDESTLIREILVLALGPAWRYEIERFLDFRL